MTVDQIITIIDKIGGWVLVWIVAYCVLRPARDFVVNGVKEIVK